MSLIEKMCGTRRKSFERNLSECIHHNLYHYLAKFKIKKLQSAEIKIHQFNHRTVGL